MFWELSPKLPKDAIIASDSGSSANWFARDLKVKPSMIATLSGGLATMCPGVPYVIAAKFTHPGRPAIALVGDGAMQMLGNNGLITISKYWKQWDDPRLIVMVLNNHDLNQVTWEQRVMVGDPKFQTSQTLPDFDYAQFGRSLGLLGVEVTSPDQIADAWDQALSADRPCVIDAHTDPEIPPLPPHITFKQARKYMSSVLKDDPSTPHQVIESVKGVAESWLPGEHDKQ